MTNQRHKDGNWTFPTTRTGAIEGWEYVPIAVLMDIRDELKRLNALLHCSSFIEIPQVLREIQSNTTKRRKKAA